MDLGAYVPQDRRQALARGEALPGRMKGAALFVDISGSVPLTDALVNERGKKLGVEAVTQRLNLIYSALISRIDRHRGSVISFSGDAMTCWFDGDDGLRAASCALDMQRAMDNHEPVNDPLTKVRTPSGQTFPLTIKVAVAAGPVRRLVVGDPEIQLIDLMAGATLDRMAAAEKQARPGEVVVDAVTRNQLGNKVRVVEERPGIEPGQPFAVVDWAARRPSGRLPALEEAVLTKEQVRSWLLRPVYDRVKSGPEALLAEIRQAVALFVRFSGIDYDKDEEAPTKLDRYIRWVQATLTRYEGYLIEVTMGDKGSYLYLAFGAPLAHDDDAARAVAAALELRSLPADMPFIRNLQIGLSLGQMRAGAYGGSRRRGYGVLGDEVSLAARLMSKAEPGQILVSKRIFDATTHVYNFHPIGPVPLKGKAEPVPVFLVLGRKLTSPLFTDSLVGRAAEIKQMEAILDSVLSSGQGQILRLEGEPGIGKSHLVYEFAGRAAQGGVQVARGVCEDTLFSPWRQIFSTLFGLTDTPWADEDQAGLSARSIAQIEGRLRQANPDWLIRSPRLGDLLGLPIPNNPTTAAFNPRLRQEALFSLLIDLIQAWAQTQPLLLLMDDVHQLDEASRELTLALSRVIAQARVLLLLIHRPPDREDSPILTELNRLPYHRSWKLGELAPEGVAALVADRLPGPPSPLALSLIRAQTQGNSLFIRELVIVLRDAGDLRQANGLWILSERMVNALKKEGCLTRSKDLTGEGWDLAPEARLSAANLDIPVSSHNTMQARIDRLPEAHKTTLKAASVIGRFFALDLLAEVHPQQPDRDHLLEVIRLLEEHDFIQPEMQDVSPSLNYLFKHHITQEAAYGLLEEPDQLRLHRVVGQALERLKPDAVETLAYHFSHGGAEARDKALIYLDQAARKAQREYANETALRYYTQALNLEPRWEWLRGQVEILHTLGRRKEERNALQSLTEAQHVPLFVMNYLWGQYFEAVSEYPRAEDTFDRALDACRGDVVNEARCLNQLGLVALRKAESDNAIMWYTWALNALSEEASGSNERAAVLAETHNGLGFVHRQQGNFEAARKSYERALTLSHQSGDRLGEALALDSLGTIAYHQRKLAEAVPYHQEALKIQQEIGDRAGEGSSLSNLAQVLSDAGDYGQTEQYFRAALEIQQAIGNRWNEVNIWNGLGILYQELGDWSQAQAHLAKGLDIARGNNDVEGEIFLLSNLGLVYRDQGNLTDAVRVLNEGLERVKAYLPDDKLQIPFYLSYLSTVHLQAKRPEQAVELGQEALTLRRELDLRPRTADDLATLAKAYLELEDINSALDYARQALTILDEGDGPEFPQRDYFFCYQVLWTAGYKDDALKALRSACELVRKRAEHIQDEKLRQSFLNNVWINRDILQACQQHGLQSGSD